MTLFKKSYNEIFRRVKEGFEKLNKQKRIIPLYSVLFLTFTATPINAIKFLAPENVTTPSTIKTAFALDTTSPSIVVAQTKTLQIVPGESQNDKEIREQAEAAAKAKAQAAAQKRDTASRELQRVYTDPTDFDTIYLRAEAALGVDHRLLKAIHTVETGASGSTARMNPSGATGPMQFLPSTFRRHAVDGNGDGVADITNVEDAIFSAAQYLKDCGYPDFRKALWSYNPSTAYYNKVMRIYDSL
ncbi:MAG: lytic transglycosylase domain-containing protein [Candidatus Berkelbacteria bacterium]|nr:lytic transglycosylase domain-containing protein [Candidatus Berkelbacteria bacterium]